MLRYWLLYIIIIRIYTRVHYNKHNIATTQPPSVPYKKTPSSMAHRLVRQRQVMESIKKVDVCVVVHRLRLKQ